MSLRAWLPTFLLSFFVLGAVGCKQTRPPYGPGKGPTAEELLEATSPRIEAIQVSSARVVVNRAARGNLAFIAQAPTRFRGSVEFKGAELVTLAFHEEGYALRNKMDQLPQGFYAGPPPSDCAVEALLGIRFPPQGLVSLVLGGAPLIEEPFEIGDNKWSRKGGYEALTLRNARYIQELRFDWLGGEWQVVGGALWENAGGKKGRELWTIEHRDVTKVDGVLLPERTRITSPGRRRDNLVVITYKGRNIHPAFAQTTGDGGDDGADGGADDDGGGDDWGDDGGWENEDDGGWENAEDDGGSEPEPKPEPPPEPKPEPKPNPIPAVFRIDAAGLTPRGQLCKSRAPAG